MDTEIKAFPTIPIGIAIYSADITVRHARTQCAETVDGMMSP